MLVYIKEKVLQINKTGSTCMPSNFSEEGVNFLLNAGLFGVMGIISFIFSWHCYIS